MILTASQTDLALRCAYPFRADIHVGRRESAAGRLGTEEHARIEATLSAEPADAPDDDDPDTSATHARWVAEWHEQERARGWIPEQAIALNPRTGETRLITRGPDGHRDYSAVPLGWIAGTADGVLPPPEGLEIADWKTGQADAYRARELVRSPDGRLVSRQVGWRRPTDLGQLLTLAAGFARHYGTRDAGLQLVPANEHRLHVERARVGLLDLRLHERRLAAVLDEADGDAKPRPGAHCKSLYCPLHGHCPATSEAARELVPALRLSRFVPVRHSAEFESPEHLGWQWQAVQAAEEALKAMRLAAVVAMRERWPGRLADGSTVALEPQSRETVDLAAPGAEAVLRRELGAAADAAIETKRSTSKGAIYEAVRPAVDAAKEAARAAGEKLRGISYAAAQERVVEALRAVGAVRRSEFETPKVVPPKLPEPAEPAAMCSRREGAGLHEADRARVDLRDHACRGDGRSAHGGGVA